MKPPKKIVPLNYQDDLERYIKRRVGSVMFWRILAIVFAGVALFGMWFVAAVVLKFGYQIGWLLR